MIRPNAILVNVADSEGKRWSVVYIHLPDGKWTHTGHPYVETTDLMNGDPFVRWMMPIPGEEWVHPVHAVSDGNNGWYLKAYDTFFESRWEGQSMSLEEMNKRGILFQAFGKLLDSYASMTDEELEKELNVGRI